MTANRTTESGATAYDPWDPWPSTAQQVARTLAVPSGMNSVCSCGVPDGESEATNPDNRTQRLPHHFDCVAVTAWAVATHVRDQSTPPEPRGGDGVTTAAGASRECPSVATGSPRARPRADTGRSSSTTATPETRGSSSSRRPPSATPARRRTTGPSTRRRRSRRGSRVAPGNVRPPRTRHARGSRPRAFSPDPRSRRYPDAVTVSTLPRLAEAGVAARGSADLYRFSSSDRIPDAAFAAASDGSVLVSGVDVLKSGTFNGLTLTDLELQAMVERFHMLRDSGVFVPPFRLDHSWSVLSVIGYYEELETYRRVDETDGVEKMFLRGDIRLTGSVDYDPAQLVKAIKRGALRSRSSEIGYYVTNTGTELPLVFYGCAFVDIPAVEGLAPVKLSKRPEPHSIVNLNADPEGSRTMDPEQLARLAQLRASTTLTPEESTELGELEEAATAAGVTDEDVAAADPEAGEDGAGEGSPAGDDPEAGGDAGEGSSDPDPAAGEGGETDTGSAGDPGSGEGDPSGDPAGGTGDDAPAAGGESAELAAARAEIARLRAAEVTRTIAELRAGGNVTDANEEHARALLSHDDEDVRRRAGALLGSMPARIELRTPRGSTALSGGQNAGGGLIRLGMSKDEVGPLWANLSSEERKQRQGEYDAWAQHRRDNGITD